MAWKKNKKTAEEEITSSADPNPENNEAIFGDLWNNQQNDDVPAEEETAPEESSDEEFQLPDDGSIQIAYDAEGNGYYISYDQETDQYFDPYSGDVYDINSMYDAEGNPFKFFATAEIPEENSGESPANEPLYEDSSSENQTPVQDSTADDDVVSDNLSTYNNQEAANAEVPQVSENQNLNDLEVQKQSEDQLQPQENDLTPEPIESNVQTVAEKPIENKEDLQISQVPQEQFGSDNNLSEQTTLSNQESPEFSLNSAPNEARPLYEESIKPSPSSADNFSVNETSASEQIDSSEFKNKNENLSAINVEPVSQSELPIQKISEQEQLPANLIQKVEPQPQINQSFSNFNVNQTPEVQSPVNVLLSEPAPEVKIQSEVTQEITEPVYDNYEVKPSQSSFASLDIHQPQSSIPSYNNAASVEANNYQQQSEPSNNIFIPAPQPTAFNDQVLSSLPAVEQSYSNFTPTPETFNKPVSTFSVVENSPADNVFANKTDIIYNTQPQPDLSVSVREEPTTEIFLDSVNDEINQITNEPKTDYTHPLPISAVLNPPLSFEENNKQEVETNKIHYIAYETPKVKNSFWSKYVGNENYGHLDESGKWIWDGYFYDNEEFVPNKSAENELEIQPAVNDSFQDDDQVNYEAEFKLDEFLSDEDDNEEIIPVSSGESSEAPKSYTNSEYDSDIKILSDEQATKLISDSDNEQVELISEDSKLSKEKIELGKEEEITVEEILPQKTSMPEQDLNSQNYKLVEEVKEFETTEQTLVPNLQEPLPKSNNLSTFEEPTNELEQLTSEIVSGDQTEISEDSLFKTEKYDEEVKKSFASTLDFLVKSKQEANTVYKKISKELRTEIENLTKNIEKLKIEFKDNEGRIRSQKSEIMRTLSNDFNPGNNYTSGRDFDNLQHAQDYNKHLLQTIKDNETRLVVLISNQKQLKVVYENRIIKINSDINKMQKIISNVNSANYSVNLLTNSQNIINDNNNYQNQANSFLPTPMNNYLTNPANSLVPFENTVGIYNSGNDLLFDNNNISNILNDYQERSLLSPTGLIQNQSPFNLSDSIFSKKSLDFDNNFSDPLSPLSYPSLDEYKSNYFDDDFETLVPDRTSSLDDLLGGNNSFITGTDELFNDDYDTKVSFTDDLENILSK